MKKLISLFAACAMLAAMLCAVPAQATPYSAYPYVYEDLEARNQANFGLLSNSTDAVHGPVADPTGRSGSVYRVSIAPKNTNFSFVDAVQIKDIPVKMGTTMKASLMAYMATGTPRTNNVSIVYNIKGTTLNADGSKSNQEFSGWYEQPVNITWTPGTWQKLEKTVTWSEDLTYGVSGSTPLGTNTIDYDSIKIYRILFRIGSGNNAAFIVDESKLLNGADSLVFYFDEMVYEPYYENVEEVEYGKNLFTYGDFENNKTTGYYAHADGKENRFIATTKKENGNTFLNIANPDGAYAWNQLMYIGENGEQADIRYLPNRMYEFTFRYRVNELYDQNKTCGTATGADAADVYIKWGIGNGSGANEKLDLNGLYTSANWPDDKYPQENMILLDGEWHEAKINFHFDAMTFAEPIFRGKPFYATIVFQAHQSNKWAPMHMDMDMDDIRMIDCGPITNGDFEQATGYATRWVNSAGTGATGNKMTYSVYGWYGDGSTLTSSDVVRANSDSTKSMMVKLNAGGRPLQALSLDPKEAKCYKLSFWAKDALLADGESVPFAVVLERKTKVTTAQANEVYSVPSYEFYTGTNEKVSGEWIYNKDIMDKQQWRLTNEWQYYETYITTEFPVMAGKENASTQNILPRQPLMYFLYNGSNPAGATYYVDDVNIEKVTGPKAENFTLNGNLVPGEKITASYTYTNAFGDAEGASIVRVYADGVSLGSFKAQGGAFTVPEAAIGKNVTFELIPVDTKDRAGATLTATAEMASDWAKIYIGGDQVSARLYAGKPMSGKLIFAAYNGKELTSVEAVDVSVTSAYTLVNVPTTEFTLEEATRVKVMFWDGTEKAVPYTLAESANVK